MVVHKHVSIGNRFVNLPGYLVKKNEEQQILVHLDMHKGSSNKPQEQA
jgi:small subunit ribosomal protein S4